jgi:hypothetical protein
MRAALLTLYNKQVSYSGQQGLNPFPAALNRNMRDDHHGGRLMAKWVPRWQI